MFEIKSIEHKDDDNTVYIEISLGDAIYCAIFVIGAILF